MEDQPLLFLARFEEFRDVIRLIDCAIYYYYFRPVTPTELYMCITIAQGHQPPP